MDTRQFDRQHLITLARDQNLWDLIIVLQNMNGPGPTGDVNFDGWVNIFDLYIVFWNYGLVC